MRNKKIIIILLVAILLIATGTLAYFLFFNQKEKAVEQMVNNGENSPVSQYVEGKKAGFYVMPTGGSFSQNQEINLEIKINTDQVSVSAMTVKFFLKADDWEAIKLTELKMKRNPDLVASGWVYPVNKIEEDKANKRIVGELAMVYIAPTGFDWAGEKTVATLNFKGISPTKLLWEFDKEQTKFISKEGKEIKLEVTGGNYEIN